MNAIKLILLSFTLVTVTMFMAPLAAAQTMNKTVPTTSQPLSETEKHMLFLILSNTPELQIHRMRGADDNKVFTNKDGREAVFDGQGKLVQDGMNQGTFNMANPVTDPFGHFDMDIHPWILMGASRSDPTDRQERIFAYISDLQEGILVGWEKWPDVSKQDFNPGQAQVKIPMAWVAVFKDPAAKELFNLMQGDLPNIRKGMPDNLQAIYKALIAYYDKF